jgi:CubicO group peptidase (beta-lactamase class C family)
MDLKEWANDPRSTLTLREMLRMSDGLDFDEIYHPAKDAPTMLFTTPHTSDIVFARHLRVHRGQERCFSYSSATTNILCRFMRENLKSDYLSFPERALFRPLGMRQAVLETDAGGTFVGSSFGWASARDWARFGQLYANDGMWPDGQGAMYRLLPDGWVNFSSTPAPSSDNVYGAHFWLGGRLAETERTQVEHCNKLYPTRSDPPRDWVRKAFPSGTFFAHGFEEQVVAIVPSKDTVLIRFGSTKEVVLQWQKPEFYAAILDTIPDV